MILTARYGGFLTNLGREYFVSRIEMVPDLKAWATQKGSELNEPAQPMKLIRENEGLAMGVQAEVGEEALDNVITAVGVRWALRDTVTNIFERLNTVKKKLGFYFLKEYARTMKNVGGSEILEDDWAMQELEKLGCFRE